MRTDYRKSSHNAEPDGFEWGITVAAIAFLVIITGLPSVVVGLLAQRYTYDRYSWSWIFWFLLLFPSAYLIYVLYTHGLDRLLMKEWLDYIRTIEHYQTDFLHWNIKQLWSDTWPVWLRTLAAVPWVAFFQECVVRGQGGQTSKYLEQHERRRLRSIKRGKRRARRRTQHPSRLPDAVGDMMVIGVPIHDEEQE